MIDLHTHSKCSDGTDPPERLPELAAASGCSAFALTDHDTLDGLASARARADDLDIRLIPGCEVSCAFRGRSAHVLVYFVEPGVGPFQEELTNLQNDRVRRNRALADRLAELGMAVAYEEMVAASPGGEASLGRPHVAGLLVEKGFVESIPDAFETWLAEGRPAFVEKARLTPGEAATLAGRSGGVAVLAHPFSLGLDAPDLDDAIGELAEAGIEGMEVHYGAYPDYERRILAEIAARHGIVATGGSDYHGTVKVGLAVGVGRGDLHVPDEALEQLEARRPLTI